MDEQRKGFLEVESSAGECAMKIVEMTRKFLKHYINLVDKAEFERIGSNFESFILGKLLPNNIACCREIVHEKKSPWVRQTSLLSYFKKWPHGHSFPTFSSHHSYQSAAINIREDLVPDYDSLKAQVMVNIF